MAEAPAAVDIHAAAPPHTDPDPATGPRDAPVANLIMLRAMNPTQQRDFVQRMTNVQLTNTAMVASTTPTAQGAIAAELSRRGIQLSADAGGATAVDPSQPPQDEDEASGSGGTDYVPVPVPNPGDGYCGPCHRALRHGTPHLHVGGHHRFHF